MKAEDQGTVLPEPLLQFRYQQEMVSPHDGLALFGPCDADTSSRPAGITYALIATDDGNRAFAQWSRAMTQAAVVDPGKMSTRLWPPFPGFDAAFGAAWPRAAGWWHRVDAAKLADACRLADAHRRANDTVELYLEGLALAHKRDEAFGVVICIVPDDVWLYCRPESEVTEAIGPRLSSREKRQRQAGVLNLFEDYEGIWYQRSRDFRRQFKLRAMEYGLPVQIVKQSTLVLEDESPTRDLTPLSDRMWNLSTTLYYKCGGKPWRLANPRPGVCYIGLSYHQTGNSDNDRTACCAALMFVDDGDGIVFRGETGPWWSRKTKEFHISKDTAAQLLAGALRTHAEMGGEPISEVFIHAKSGISAEEYAGFVSACPTGARVVAVRIRQEWHGVKLYRRGDYPVARGTYWRVNDHLAFLWASGFKPRLGTYDGFEVPNPLRIDIQHGDADIDTVARDVLALTKLDYNACKLGAGEPVTIRFSDAVGEILVTSDPSAKGRPNFKFYI